jgi:PAS domain S-box-containing protein
MDYRRQHKPPEPGTTYADAPATGVRPLGIENHPESAFDALTAHICVIDAVGRIIEVNAAWRRFADENGLRMPDYAIGASYLDVCQAATGPDFDSAALVADGIQAVLDGSLERFELEYSCDSPSEPRWFVVRITRFASDGPARAVIAHENVTAQRMAEERLRARARQQAMVAELGRLALSGTPLVELMDMACARVVSELGLDVCVLYQLLPGGNDVILAHAAGLEPGVIGTVHPASVETLIGAALENGTSAFVAGNPLPAQLTNAGIGSALCVLVGEGAHQWGVLLAGTRAPREAHGNNGGGSDDSVGEDAHVLQSVAAILAAAAERERADDALAESEQRFRDLVDLAPDLIFSISAEHATFEALNPAFEQILGWERADWLGCDAGALNHPDDLPVARAALQAIIGGATPPPFEQRARHKDGHYRVLEIRSAPRFEDGQVTELFGIARDVTERQLADEELRRSRDQLEVILQGVEDGITVQDRTGRLIYANQTAARLCGFPDPESLIAAELSEFLRRFALFDEAGHFLPIERLPGRRAMLGERPDPLLVRFRVLETGAERWSVVRATPVFDVDGSVQLAVNIFHDVTEVKRSEQRLSVQYAVSRVLATSRGLDEAGERILAAIGDGLELRVGALWLADPATGVIRCRMVWSDGDTDISGFKTASMSMEFAPGIGLPGRVWASGEPVWIRDVLLDANFPRALFAAHDGLHAAFSFPIRLGEAVMGAIEFFTPEYRPPDEDTLHALTALGSQIGQFIERERAEAALRESDARKGAILETAVDAIINIDANSRITEFNPAAEQMFGYRRDDVLGQDLAELIIPPALRDQHRRGIERFLAHGTSSMLGRQVELTAQGADGSEFPVEVAITLIPSSGPPTFAGYIRDITARKRGEETQQLLAEAGEVLSASLDYEATLHSLASLAVPALCQMCAIDLIREDGVIERAVTVHTDPDLGNAISALLQQYPRSMQMDTPLTRILRDGRPGVAPAASEGLRQMVQQAGDQRWDSVFEDGDQRLALVVPLRTRGKVFGAIIFVSAPGISSYDAEQIALAHELVRRGALAIENARLYREAQQAARAREEFLSIASHELKTPLTSVKASAQLLSRRLEREGLTGARLTNVTGHLHREIARLETLVADLLDATRIQQGRLELRPARADLAQIAADVIARFEHAPERGEQHTLRLDAPAPVAGVWDAARLDQVLTNLVSNALKYSPDGGDVLMRVFTEDDEAVVTVHDHGIGISAEEQARLFQPFSRGDIARQSVGGTGLGLYIAAQIVDQHGGSISIDSEAGKGSVFTVRLSGR